MDIFTSSLNTYEKLRLCMNMISNKSCEILRKTAVNVWLYVFLKIIYFIYFIYSFIYLFISHIMKVISGECRKINQILKNFLKNQHVFPRYPTRMHVQQCFFGPSRGSTVKKFLNFFFREALNYIKSFLIIDLLNFFFKSPDPVSGHKLRIKPGKQSAGEQNIIIFHRYDVNKK